MTPYTQKSISIALLCSVAFHLMLVFTPKRTEYALINNNQGISQLKLTLARNANPVTSLPVPVKGTEEKLPEETASKPPENIQQAKDIEKPAVTKSSSLKKAPSPAKIEKLASKTILPKEAGAQKNIDRPVPQADNQHELSASDNSLKGMDSTTEFPAESMESSAMKSWQSDLVQRINKQKRYPRQALRRGLEGDVKVKAMILPDGSLGSAEIVSGDRRFKTSSLQAVSRALPFPPPVAVLKPITVSFIIHYTIN